MARNLAKRSSIIDLTEYIDQKIHVKFLGGREVVGILKGADPVCNLVLDETMELLRDSNDNAVVTSESRKLGIVIARGQTVLSICQ